MFDSAFFHPLAVPVRSVRVFRCWKATWQFFFLAYLKENPKEVKPWYIWEVPFLFCVNLFHKQILINSFHITVLPKKSVMLWLLRNKGWTAKAETALMEAAQPQVSFSKDVYVGRSGVCSPLAIWFSVSMLWLEAEVKFCQYLVA